MVIWMMMGFIMESSMECVDWYHPIFFRMFLHKETKHHKLDAIRLVQGVHQQIDGM